MECGHRSICLECFKKDGRCPECGNKLEGVKDKYIADLASVIQGAIDSVKKDEEAMKMEMEIDQIKKDDNEVEEETKRLNDRVEESDEKYKQKQDEIDAFSKDVAETRKRLEDADEENVVIARSMTEAAEKEEAKQREIEETRRRQERVMVEKEAISKAIKEDSEKREKLSEDMSKIQEKIQACERRSEKGKKVELDLKFIGEADQMFNAIDEENSKKAQQSTGTWMVQGTVECMKSVWALYGGSKGRDPEEVLESYCFYE